MQMWKRYPLGATVLGATGAILIVLEGVLFVGLSWSIPAGSIFGNGLGSSTATMGIVAIVEGGLALGLMLLVYAQPRLHTFVGIGAITVSLLSLFSGGGFLLGALLLWVGGAVAIYFGLERDVPEYIERPADHFDDEEVPQPSN
jgi:hypothetical protein